jgi:uncharacterized protein (TIGR00730 family)
MKPIDSICVFCASSQSVPDLYKEAASDLGRRMGRRGLTLIYGGASIGLMGCVARGVHAGGGRVVGILPKFFMRGDIAYAEADELIVTRDLRERKAIMDERADAFIALPGGVGTLEEAIEILSLIQLRQTAKPLALIDTGGFYRELLALFEKMIALRFAKPETLNLFALAPDPESALDAVLNFKPARTETRRL